MLGKLLIALLLLCSAANAMSDRDRSAIETISENALSEMSSVSSVSAAVNSDNVLEIWIVPVGECQNESNIISAIGGATGVFIEARHTNPELEQMNLTLGVNENDAVSKLYCLGSWADSVRYNGNEMNSDDIGAVGLKVLETMQPLT